MKINLLFKIKEKIQLLNYSKKKNKSQEIIEIKENIKLKSIVFFFLFYYYCYYYFFLIRNRIEIRTGTKIGTGTKI